MRLLAGGAEHRDTWVDSLERHLRAGVVAILVHVARRVRRCRREGRGGGARSQGGGKRPCGPRGAHRGSHGGGAVRLRQGSVEAPPQAVAIAFEQPQRRALVPRVAAAAAAARLSGVHPVAVRIVREAAPRRVPAGPRSADAGAPQLCDVGGAVIATPAGPSLWGVEAQPIIPHRAAVHQPAGASVLVDRGAKRR